MRLPAAWSVKLLWSPMLAFGACGDRAETPPRGAGLDLRTVLASGDATGFARALEPPQLQFPRDHGPHPSFRTEWWYWTGNVATEAGRAFGFELVFFRQALAPPRDGPPRAASLASDQIVLAHAAVTDVQDRRFHSEERVARRDGVRADLRGGDVPLHLFVGDWSAAATVTGDGFSPLRLTARGGEFAFAIELALQKPIVLQGDRGLSQKSSAPGNASIYYSAVRLAADGTIEVGGASHAVRGTAWCDREWSTSALDEDQIGWDWFSLQLDDDTELMWYRLRRSDGSEDPHSQGLLVSADGRSERLLAGEVTTRGLGEWRADDGRARYPAAWRLAVPRLQLDLEVTPLLASQELRAIVRYWEGAVAVRGTRAAVEVTGRGYLEMTGYAK